MWGHRSCFLPYVKSTNPTPPGIRDRKSHVGSRLTYAFFFAFFFSFFMFVPFDMLPPLCANQWNERVNRASMASFAFGCR